MHTRYCPACQEEFRPEIVSCSDCGAILEDRYGDEDAAVQAPLPETPREGPEISREDGFRVFSSSDSAAVQKAAARLRRAGVRVLVNPGFDILVTSADSDAAMEALRGRDGAVSMTPGADSARTEGRCPACGATVPAGAAECPECQLVVGDDEEPAHEEG
jgi:hypothetical protein